MISVIIPLYNNKDYIYKCLASLSVQSYRDFECIVVDDGSTDGSGDIVDLFAQDDCRFRVLHIENGGVSNARNTGISHSRGEYIVFVDSDDFVNEHYLWNLYVNMDKNTDMVVSGFQIFGENTICTLGIPEELSIHILESCSADYSAVANLLHSPCARIYRNDIIHQYSLEFRIDMKLGEDLCFNLDYLARSGNVKFIPFVDYYYRNNGPSLSRRSKYPLKELYQAVGNHKEFLKKYNKWDFEGKKYLYKQLGGYLYDALFDSNSSYSNMRTFVRVFEHEDLSGCIQYFNYPWWLKMSLKCRLPILIYLIKRFYKETEL